MMKRYTTIAGLSEARRLPRIGKLRLGMKVMSKGGKEIPKELDYFLLHPPGPDDPISAQVAYSRFRDVYGEAPKELEIIIPSDDPGVFFPQRYKCYGSSGLRCIGDGSTAERIGSAMGKQGDEAAEFFEIGCPTPDECEFAQAHGCRPVGSLFVILPQVSLGGCFQIDVSGVNSILNINSAIEHIRTLCGRVSGLVFQKQGEIQSALCLKRVPMKTQGGGHLAVHFPLALELQMNMSEFQEVMAGRGFSSPSPQTCLGQTCPETLPSHVAQSHVAQHAAASDDLPKERPPAPAAPATPEQHGATEGRPEMPPCQGTGAESQPAIWDRIDAAFEILDITQKASDSYRRGYARRPADLLAFLQRKAEREGLEV